ncbi:MAG: hydrogenase expression/formation protein HypE [Gemmatimonadales bacterium]
MSRADPVAWPATGPTCPVPRTDTERVLLGHGSGGKLSAALVRERFLPHFGNPILAQLGDGALVELGGGSLVVSTDTFVVRPLEFPGGDIGSLAIHGTVNDVAMMGARPRFLTAGFVLEEGLDLALLDRIVATMANAAREAGVLLVTADTKVVDRGNADGLYVNTTGIGEPIPGFSPAPALARPGDRILVSGPLGRHGMAIMAAREGLALQTEITSDTANLWPLVERLHEAAGADVHVLRDPTRGGLASALNEIATAARIGVQIDEGALAVPDDVRAACELLGLDPLYVANEGVLVAFLSPDAAEGALAAVRDHPLGRDAALIGQAVPRHAGTVVMKTGLGGTRIVDLLPGDQLPRIC